MVGAGRANQWAPRAGSRILEELETRAHDSKLGRRFWDAGRKEGRQEGLGAVVHRFERKVGRALTEKEREVLYARSTSTAPRSPRGS